MKLKRFFNTIHVKRFKFSSNFGACSVMSADYDDLSHIVLLIHFGVGVLEAHKTEVNIPIST
jgi:hypothetical protein